MTSRPASMPSVLYHLRALLLAVSGGDKLDTMPQEGTFMKRMFALRTTAPLPIHYAAAPLQQPRRLKSSHHGLGQLVNLPQDQRRLARELSGPRRWPVTLEERGWSGVPADPSTNPSLNTEASLTYYQRIDPLGWLFSKWWKRAGRGHRPSCGSGTGSASDCWCSCSPSAS
jgi:hypothetical protein